MLQDIVEVQPLDDYKLRLRFQDGAEGIVKLTEIVEFKGVFAPLRDPAYFAQVHVSPELGTIAWPNDADLDPDVLYALVQGKPIPSLDFPAPLTADK